MWDLLQAFIKCNLCHFFVSVQGDADSGSGEYVSIHITPEMAYSYVSFETNMPKTDYMTIAMKV